MSSDGIAIQARGLSKQYRIAHKGSRPTNLVEAIRSLGRGSGTTREAFWALEDASFDVRAGEVVGIIGRNGAGKSTLLKILSRIVEPTRGEAVMVGRLGSLLEVGTGFHPELTGRENIFLNGAILGMRASEVRRHFDEIVDFSGVERFLDTPVKRYSSGMYVRLAFAVAAHLRADILIVDEVLAVGDAAFQQKCLSKMGDVVGEGRTVLFVSHNMSAVSALTQRCILLKQGHVTFDGPTDSCIEQYLAATPQQAIYSRPSKGDTPSITRVEVTTSHPGQMQAHGAPMQVVLDVSCPIATRGAKLYVRLVDRFGRLCTSAWLFDSEMNYCRETGNYRLVCSFPRIRLGPGHYTVNAIFAVGSHSETLDNVAPFEVTMYGRVREGGWAKDQFAYIEEFTWSSVEAGSCRGGNSKLVR